MNDTTPTTVGEPQTSGPERSGAWRVASRVAAVLLSVGLLGGTLWFALGNEANRDAIGRLADASQSQVLGLVGLSVLAIVLNGLIFWLLILPVKQIGLVGTIATNAIATFLASVPFKLSVMARVAIHVRRDGVPLAYVGPWFAAIAASLAGSIGPLVVAAYFQRDAINARWVGIAGGLVLASWGAMVLLARSLGNGRGIGWLRAIGRKQPIQAVEDLVHTPFVTKLDEGLGMLCDPVTVGMVLVIRLLDLMGVAGRFLIAASVIGIEMTFADAFIYAITYFVIGVVSPTGSLGAREGGTALVAVLLADEDAQRVLAVVPIVVGGAELLVNAACAGLGVVYVRPDRLLQARGADDPAGDPAADDGGGLGSSGASASEHGRAAPGTDGGALPSSYASGARAAQSDGR